jgi:Na+-translocating ferredoxin:NAD+ oxidoreductase RnfA subunit
MATAAAGAAGLDPAVTFWVVAAAVAAFPLAVLSVLAFVRRRTISYFLVAAAFVTFFARTLTGGLAVVGVLDPDVRQLLGHGLDVAIAVCLLAAVLFARRGDPAGILVADDR